MRVHHRHQRLVRVHRCAEYCRHAGDDAGDRRAERREFEGPAGGDRGCLRLRELRRGEIEILAREHAGLRESRRPLVAVLRARERALGAARRGFEGGALEFNEGRARRDGLAGSDEDAGDARRGGGAQLGVVAGARGDCAEGLDDAREGRDRGDCRTHRDDGAVRGGVVAPPAGGDREQSGEEDFDGQGRVAVRVCNRRYAAAVWAVARSST